MRARGAAPPARAPPAPAPPASLDVASCGGGASRSAAARGGAWARRRASRRRSRPCRRWRTRLCASGPEKKPRNRKNFQLFNNVDDQFLELFWPPQGPRLCQTMTQDHSEVLTKYRPIWRGDPIGEGGGADDVSVGGRGSLHGIVLGF